MEPRIQYAKTKDGVSIAYWTMGEGEPFVCLPPIVYSHLQLEWQHPPTRAWYEQLAKTRTLVRFDPRGMGLSERRVADLSFEAFVHDQEAVVDHLELEKFALCGIQANTMRAIAYAARHPERVTHLILFHPQTKFGRDSAGGALFNVAKKDWRTYTEAHASASYGWSEGELAHALAAFMRRSVDQETWLEMVKLFARIDVTSALPEISTPTLVLARPQDRRTDASQISALASQMQNARVVFLEGTERGPQFDDAGEVLRAIDEFLGDGEPKSKIQSLPSGTAAILFLDIADSTALTTRLGDAAYRERERELDASLREAIRDAGGTPVEGKVLGDGVMAVFTSARQAIDAAQRCRDLGNEAGLPLHLGIHAGDVVREVDPDGRANVHGGAVQLASRVQSAAAPGEILVSDTLRGLARTSAGVAFEDRGEHELKGIAEPQRLFAVRTQEG